MQKFGNRLSATVVALAIACVGLAQGYQDGDIIRIIVPYSAGGGFDTYARLLEPHVESALEESTGANVNVLVENMPGAGGQVAIEYLYRSQPDGMTLAIMSSGLATAQQVIWDAAFDLSELTYIAQIDRSERSYIANRNTVPESNIMDVIDRSAERSILIGTVGLTAAAEQFLMESLLSEAGLNFNVDYVHFEGASEAIASMLRGEIDLYQVTTSGGNTYVVENPDELKWLVTLGHEKSEVDPTIPTIAEQGMPMPAQISNAVGYTRRVFIAPPDLPEGLTELLRDAFAEAIQSEEFQALAEDSNRPVVFESGSDIAPLLVDGVETFQRYESDIEAKLAEQ